MTVVYILLSVRQETLISVVCVYVFYPQGGSLGHWQDQTSRPLAVAQEFVKMYRMGQLLVSASSAEITVQSLAKFAYPWVPFFIIDVFLFFFLN